MNTAFIICTRLNSSRVPKKCMYPINGTPMIKHLVRRLAKSNFPVIIACADKERDEYARVLKGQCIIYSDSANNNNPLRRMMFAAEKHNVKNAIRVCHDKIFVDVSTVEDAVDHFEKHKFDYLFPAGCTDGSSFEIISFAALDEAAEKFKDVEHISYAIRAITNNICAYPVPRELSSEYRFLVDYPEDISLLELILSRLGNNCTLAEAIQYMDENKWAKRINKLPYLTIYTCAHNAQRFLNDCMESVENQRWFRDFEYILIDDHSKDRTPEMMARFCAHHSYASWHRNKMNYGLASSSNKALGLARGKYIMRLDADDYFCSESSVLDTLTNIMDNKKDAVYPNNYFGTVDKIQKGDVCHHIGGAVFNKGCINYVKFTEGLRGYEGFDFFVRAKDQINIGYLDKPTFFYRQHELSMSKTDKEFRKRIYENIKNQHSDKMP